MRVRWKPDFLLYILLVCCGVFCLSSTSAVVFASNPSENIASVQAPITSLDNEKQPAIFREPSIFNENIWSALSHETTGQDSNRKQGVSPYAARQPSRAAAGSTANSCSTEDVSCFCSLDTSVPKKERANCEAIRALHRTLDDDANGQIDLRESVDFIREELEMKNGDERRQRRFHNEDTQVTAKEMWEAWVKSDVHNWTVAQCVDWLKYSVDLPQYAQNFLDYGLDGASLPRLTEVNMTFLLTDLGIKDMHNKRKISLKATDAVLFGPPKEGNNAIKDAILIGLLLAALGGCYFAYFVNKRSKKHLDKLTRDLESLATAEQALQDLQEKLNRALGETNVGTGLQDVVDKGGSDSDTDLPRKKDEEVMRLKAEIDVLRYQLQQMQGELEDRCWKGPPDLQHWLQLTYELESKAYNKKRLLAEKQLEQAKEACEKLGKRGSSLFGAFVSTHGRSIDDVDKSIMEARSALTEVTLDLQERASRWKHTELLCGFAITNNPGLPHLEMLLRSGVGNRGGYLYVPPGSSRNNGPGEDDDSSSGHNQSAGTDVRARTTGARKALVKRDSTSSLESASALSNPLASGQLHSAHLPSITNGFTGSRKSKSNSSVQRHFAQPESRDHYDYGQDEVDSDGPSFQVKPMASIPLVKSISLNPSVPKPLPNAFARQSAPVEMLPSISSSTSLLLKSSPTLSERSKRAVITQKSYSPEPEPLPTQPRGIVRNSQSESALDLSQTDRATTLTSSTNVEERLSEENMSVKSTGSTDERKKRKIKMLGSFLFSKNRKQKPHKSTS